MPPEYRHRISATYLVIYVALILCLYSGGIYLYNTFHGRKKAAK